MAVNPALLIDAKRKRKELRDRQDWWDKMIDGLTRSPGAALPVLDHYRQKYNDQLADKTRNQEWARQSRYCAGLAGQENAGLMNWLQKQGRPHETDLSKLYTQHDSAEAVTRAIEGHLPGFISGPLAGETGFLARLDREIRKNNHGKAQEMLRTHKPSLFSRRRWFMSAAEKTAYAADLSALTVKVREHGNAARDMKQVQSTLGDVEKETANAIHKILRKDKGRLINILNPELEKMAKGGDPAAALLLRHAGTARWWDAFNPLAADTLVGDLRTGRRVSLASVQNTLLLLEGKFTGNQLAAKAAMDEADKKHASCEDFIKKCRLARSCELTAANGHLSRDDLGKALDDAIANHSSMSDQEMQAVLDRVKDRQAHWATTMQQVDINADAAALALPGTFMPHMMHQTAVPAFSRAARTAEQLRAGAQAVYRGAKSAYHYVVS